MSSIALVKRPNALVSILRVVPGLVEGMIRAVVQYYQRKRAYSTLMSLDDRLLKDIGLDRGQIYNAVYGQNTTGPSQVTWIAAEKRPPIFG